MKVPARVRSRPMGERKLLSIRTGLGNTAAAGNLVVAAKPCCLFAFHPVPQQGPSDPAICVVKSCVPSPQKGMVITKRWCPLSTREFWLLVSLGSGRSGCSPGASCGGSAVQALSKGLHLTHVGVGGKRGYWHSTTGLRRVLV